MPPEDPVTLGEISRRLDDYARTTGAGLDKLAEKIDALPAQYVSRREYDRDDADNEDAHREIRKTIEGIRLEREKTLADVEAKIADAKRTAAGEVAELKRSLVDSRRWVVGTLIAFATLLLGTLVFLYNVVA